MKPLRKEPYLEKISRLIHDDEAFLTAYLIDLKAFMQGNGHSTKSI
ncbi:hypothetical protein H6F74_23540 [Trichocoleus sp. FACHB-90]|nr:hypothetical protein [Trichocoleus sp. FACHB-90]MBD1929192.1 hypothetical protein [Trichocoleus sp. FACHB-90]